MPNSAHPFHGAFVESKGALEEVIAKIEAGQPLTRAESFHWRISLSAMVGITCEANLGRYLKTMLAVLNDNALTAGLLDASELPHDRRVPVPQEN